MFLQYPQRLSRNCLLSYASRHLRHQARHSGAKWCVRCAAVHTATFTNAGARRITTLIGIYATRHWLVRHACISRPSPRHCLPRWSQSSSASGIINFITRHHYTNDCHHNNNCHWYRQNIALSHYADHAVITIVEEIRPIPPRLHATPLNCQPRRLRRHWLPTPLVTIALLLPLYVTRALRRQATTPRFSPKTINTL